LTKLLPDISKSVVLGEIVFPSLLKLRGLASSDVSLLLGEWPWPLLDFLMVLQTRHSLGYFLARSATRAQFPCSIKTMMPGSDFFFDFEERLLRGVRNLLWLLPIEEEMLLPQFKMLDMSSVNFVFSFREPNPNLRPSAMIANDFL
jgi:hypothetical protein